MSPMPPLPSRAPARFASRLALVAPLIGCLRCTCAFVRRDGQWRMLALQMQPRAAK